MMESRFVFHPSGPQPWEWYVTVEGGAVDIACLTLHGPEGEWRLEGRGPLRGCRAGWAHNSRAVTVGKQPPAWLRRDVADQLGAWAINRLARFEADAEALIKECSST